MSYFVFFCWLVRVVDQLPRLEKREIICLPLFTCNYLIPVAEVSSSSRYLRMANYSIVALPEPSIYILNTVKPEPVKDIKIFEKR